jgi:hypothetical protein
MNLSGNARTAAEDIRCPGPNTEAVPISQQRSPPRTAQDSSFIRSPRLKGLPELFHDIRVTALIGQLHDTRIRIIDAGSAGRLGCHPYRQTALPPRS